MHSPPKRSISSASRISGALLFIARRRGLPKLDAERALTMNDGRRRGVLFDHLTRTAQLKREPLGSRPPKRRPRREPSEVRDKHLARTKDGRLSGCNRVHLIKKKLGRRSLLL